MENNNIVYCRIRNNCPQCFLHIQNADKLKRTTCQYMKKYGFYYTSKGEKIQRFLCIKSYRTFTHFTQNQEIGYMQNRNLPIHDIIKDYNELPHSIRTLSIKYSIGISTVRTILKRGKTEEARRKDAKPR